MFISHAYAQTNVQSGSSDILGLMIPMILIFAIMYFLMIRPQQKRQKKHQAKLSAVKRGDKVITGGGMLGIVRKVSDDGHLIIEFAKDVQIEVITSTLMDVLVKNNPQIKENCINKEDNTIKKLLANLFKFRKK